VIIEDRPEGCIYSPSSNITLNRRDIRSKFGYTIISKFVPPSANAPLANFTYLRVLRFSMCLKGALRKPRRPLCDVLLDICMYVCVISFCSFRGIKHEKYKNI
jgi:hypothetical protein